MEPGKYDNPQQPLTTTLGTTLGAEAIPLETPASDDARRTVREPVPGEEHHMGRSGPGPKIMAADTLEGDDVVNTAGEKLGALEHIMIDVPSGVVRKPITRRSTTASTRRFLYLSTKNPSTNDTVPLSLSLTVELFVRPTNRCLKLPSAAMSWLSP